jgi:hypothetical protein
MSFVSVQWREKTGGMTRMTRRSVEKLPDPGDFPHSVALIRPLNTEKVSMENFSNASGPALLKSMEFTPKKKE